MVLGLRFVKGALELLGLEPSAPGFLMGILPCYGVFGGFYQVFVCGSGGPSMGFALGLTRFATLEFLQGFYKVA